MKEETIEEQAERGEKVFNEIFQVKRKDALAGNFAEYILIENSQKLQDLYAYFINKEKLNPITDSEHTIILGLKIINNSKKILTLP